ncbi:bc76ea4d-ec02-4817-a54c-4f13fd989e14 [Thermothielavioides terrestris]|uniref:Uncharacterized protein n=2 Tax=Thermothielavioides terrestris TaxID=2587410 RepID=G2RC68_THETT|nr:uncharacterized protein THITE_2119738 [Thermothielavioides terrestris NRRL 8126]AEO69389.1 hypothetical protein THITE_2119738 [Thermothielavioides terrestris NRRL 8126]SPQ22343.1 bc76ea4d-ec02-4817-a54c-4f13fd989e14 [Thermothielavioides terrestris]
MSTEVFRRVGRGGAGNFYSKKDVEEAEKAGTEDLEAQRATTTTTTSEETLSFTRTQTTSPTITSATAPSYGRTGRGGAGNFALPNPNAAPHTTPLLNPNSAAPHPEEAAPSPPSLPVPKRKTGGLSGRGGAGNWTGGEDGTKQQEEEDKQRRVEELEMQVLRDVEVGLAPPPRVYQTHTLGSGRGGGG